MFGSILMFAAAVMQSGSDPVIWHWDRETPNCTLQQRTDDGRTVSITRNPGEDDTAVSFNVRSPKFWKGLYEDGTVTLSAGSSFPATIQVYSVDNRQYRLTATITDPGFLKLLANSAIVTVGHRQFGRFSVSPRKLSAAIPALQTCENERMRSWSIDVNAYWALASRPRPIGNLGDLFDSDVYPELAAMRDLERNVIAATEVSSDGSVTSCSAPGHFEYPQFVDAVCNVLKKGARFEPARDQSGNKVAAPYVVVVAFRMRAF